MQTFIVRLQVVADFKGCVKFKGRKKKRKYTTNDKKEFNYFFGGGSREK